VRSKEDQFKPIAAFGLEDGSEPPSHPKAAIVLPLPQGGTQYEGIKSNYFQDVDD